MFYLTTHLTHLIYIYMASDIMVKHHSVREETYCRLYMGYSFRLAARVLLYAPSHRRVNAYHGLCYTNFCAGVSLNIHSFIVTPVVEHYLEREIVQWVHHDGSIWRTLYHGDTSRSRMSAANV